MTTQDYFIELVKLKAKADYHEWLKAKPVNLYPKGSPEFKAYKDQMKELGNGTGKL